LRVLTVISHARLCARLSDIDLKPKRTAFSYFRSNAAAPFMQFYYFLRDRQPQTRAGNGALVFFAAFVIPVPDKRQIVLRYSAAVVRDADSRAVL
jgi:hypothetical protein